MATRPAKSTAQMCVVTIDYHEYLLPLNKGLALVDLMQHAKKCNSNFSISAKKLFYTEDAAPQIEMEVVSANQLKSAAERPDNDL